MTHATAHLPATLPRVSPGPYAEMADVRAVDGATLTVLADGVPRQARLALSCLVQPEPHDQVLVAQARGELWVLAVLHRDAPGPVRLQARGDLEIAAAGAVSIQGSSITVRARVATVLVEELSCIGQAVTAHIARARLIGQAVETLVERVMLRAKRSYRFVEETDQLRSRDINHRADETLHLHGTHAFVTATGIVKMDGSQIHMG